MKRNAFTLIELLVVISIIAILMSVLMPSLQRAREQARTVICKANLNQLGVGFQIYTQENNGKVPVIYDSRISGTGNAQWMPAWYVLVGAGIGWKEAGATSVDLTTNNVIHCPSTKRELTDEKGNQMGHQDNWSTSHYTTSMYNRNTKINKIKQPSEYVFLSDGRPAYYWFNPHMVFPRLSWPTQLIVTRHADKANELYFDMHIGQVSEEEMYDKTRLLIPYQVAKNPPTIPLP